MKKSELRKIIKEVISELGGQIVGMKNRSMIEGGQTREAEATFSIRSVDGLDISVIVTYTSYRGSTAPDDPSSIDMISVIAEQDTMLAGFIDPAEVLDPKEQKIIKIIQHAVQVVYPHTPAEILIPKGADILKLDEKLGTLLDADLMALKDELSVGY